MDAKWDRIVADRGVIAVAILGMIFGMFVPLLVKSRAFVVTVDEKAVAYSAVAHSQLFWSVVASCIVISIACILGAVIRGMRLYQNEKRPNQTPEPTPPSGASSND